ncbi:cyclic nucleotide-binding domain-containing protein [Hymenobacter sp. BT770]|uniref:cyclic nucleotide-binding domain-containing protein n=1 Tax=Hymenobacter sp. BT770 TaxID=2886942 RepID=UPI001D1107CE|nr:cyclic nucleotide-binding domain-containing protein [Hymenobacter sp. BT770]MCC3153553.1 cyclic nucleotide-binding domain-containing protein [Hymenobacter sp. BT770]MDO3415789.1 cyclic nucleotide-binding domain-containing protein [Hymenobacter sp. BT770]
MEKWYRFLGVRPSETKTVWLFFVHNFLLGIGTILVYVAANVLLLAEHPERNLPLAYCAGAVAMMVVGRLYAYYERKLQLSSLAVRTLMVTVVLTLVLGLVLLRGPSVVAAVAIMTGYRLIYLLTNLEFWGMSSVVFNVRQGRRLFSVISSGDMPAKALGAVLTIFVHAHNALYALLLTASAFYLLALFIQRATFRAQTVVARPGPVRESGRELTPLFRQFFGASPLVRAMGLSLTAIAAVAVGVEYLFFVNVKYKLQDQTTILQYVGGVLALTYMLAMLFKLGFSRHSLDRLGVRWTLALLPLLAFAGVLLFGVLQSAHMGPSALMAYFGGLYLVLEVLRRAVFEPVFLVLLQPLAAPERLEGHSLVKGFYEPLGLGLGGLLLLGLPQLPELNLWVPFVWMGLLLLGSVFLLQRTYWTYIDELKRTLGLRFTTDAASDSALHFQPETEYNGSRISPTDAIQAIDYLHKAEAAAVVKHAEHLLKHTDSRVRYRVLSVVGQSADVALLRRLAMADPDPALRETASELASRHPESTDLLEHPDLAVRKGAIRGRLETTPTDAPARASLAAIVASDETSSRLAALALVDLLTPEQQVELVTTSLCNPDPMVVSAAVQAAAETSNQALMEQLIALLRIKAVQKYATTGLVKIGAASLPLLKQALARETDSRGFQSLAQVCAHLATPAARQLLVELAQGPNLVGRAAALRALSSFATEAADTPLFQRLVEEEMRLAQQLLHGMVNANAELRAALRYELRKGQQRIFGLLAQVYERQPILDAQRGVAHTAGERQANALEMLDNLIPRPLYHGLQAMLDVGRLRDKVRKFDDLLGPTKASESIQTVIVRGGTAAFSIWTISLALQQWHPQPDTVAYLYPHLESTNLLIQENATAVLRQLPIQRPAAYDQLISLFPSVASLLMSPQGPTSSVSARERVLMLKGTTLFAETPENVLSTIMPIMKEVAFQPEQQIFAKGHLGTSLFIISEGEVGIFDGSHHLTTFRKGEFFGELALLDAEARSATAQAMCKVVAFRIDQEDFYDVMEECPEVVRNVMRVLCQRLRRQNEKMQTIMPAET